MEDHQHNFSDPEPDDGEICGPAMFVLFIVVPILLWYGIFRLWSIL